MQFYTLTWASLHRLVHRMAGKIEKDNLELDLIVAIARGGLTVSHILSDFLVLPVVAFTIKTYGSFQQQRAPEVRHALGTKVGGKRVLLVDDVSDTGETFIKGIEYLKTEGAARIYTAAPLLKPWTKYTPDYWVKKTESWIIFPFNMKETVRELRAHLQKEGKSESEIRAELDKLHLPRVFIE